VKRSITEPCHLSRAHLRLPLLELPEFGLHTVEFRYEQILEVEKTQFLTKVHQNLDGPVIAGVQPRYTFSID